MNIKSIAALGLVAVAMTVTSFLPAEANNNNQALNMMAMQMYMQNQANAGNYNRYNPLQGGASMYSPIQNAAYGLNAVNYGGGYGGGCNGAMGMGASPYNNMVSSPQYQRLASEAAQIQSQLAYGNLPYWKVNSLQNKLAKIQRQETNLSAYGYGNPYSYGNGGGILNNLRYNLGI
jgi:hypothetical protein